MPAPNRPRRAPRDSVDSFECLPAGWVAGGPEGTQGLSRPAEGIVPPRTLRRTEMADVAVADAPGEATS
jgi:hypothetical protein